MANIFEFLLKDGNITPEKARKSRQMQFHEKQHMFGVFPVDEILRYRWTQFVGSRTLCHPAVATQLTYPRPRGLGGTSIWIQIQIWIWIQHKYGRNLWKMSKIGQNSDDRWDPSLSMNPVRRFAHFMPPWSGPVLILCSFFLHTELMGVLTFHLHGPSVWTSLCLLC